MWRDLESPGPEVRGIEDCALLAAEREGIPPAFLTDRNTPYMLTLVLLTLSNVFMTFAWYGHLKYSDRLDLKWAILISWGIAFFEYCLQVPGNRLGKEAGWSTTQLKVIQEAITIVVFLAFVLLFMKERPAWNDYLGISLVAIGVMVTMGFAKSKDTSPASSEPAAATEARPASLDG